MRSWQFLLVVAVVIGALTYFYYNSDYYAKRAAAPAGESNAPAETVPANLRVLQ